MRSPEFALIDKYFRGLSQHHTQVVQGVGDDCAVLQPRAGYELVISTDTLLADVHFPAAANAKDIATRSLAVCLSDLAAMGAEALGFTLALSLPSVEEAWLKEFSSGLRLQSDLYAIPLVGGDTTAGALAITITVLGEVPAGTALLRSGAAAGDSIYVSGSLGDGAMALQLLQQQDEFTHPQQSYFVDRFYAPFIDLSLGAALRDIASAAIDVSDGLLADLGHILMASGVGADIYTADLPLLASLQELPPEEQRRLALSGGDDYRLCFTVPAAQPQAFDTLTVSNSLQADSDLHCIGKITAQTGVRCYDANNKEIEMATDIEGYDHFAKGLDT